MSPNSTSAFIKKSTAGARLLLTTQLTLRCAERKASDREELFVAERDGRPAGCIMLCQTEDPAVGQLRLFAVEKTNGVAEWARLC